MSSKIYRLFLFVLLIVIMSSTALWAKDKTTIAVLPFSVHSSENIEYVRQGIMDMLTSRISANDNIAVISKESILDLMATVKSKDLSPAEVSSLGKRLKADYAVWGSITKIGNSVSIDGKLVDIKDNKAPVNIFTQSPGMDDVISKITDFAQRINQYVMGSAPSDATSAAGSALATSTPAAAVKPATREAQIIAGMKSGRRSTLTGSINPDFITGAQPLDKKSFWMSAKYPTEFRGMDIGDVNGDGLNEIVAIDNNNVYVFQKKGNEMVLLQKISSKNYEKFVGVDLFSLTGNNCKDIIVSNVFSRSGGQTEVNNSAQSFILTWKDGKFQKVADNLPWIFRVINQSGESRLLGQQFSVGASAPSATSKPFQSPIHEMVWRNGKIAEGKRLKIPNGLCIYGLTIDNLGEGKDKIIALNAYDYLMVLDESDKDLTKIETLFGAKEILFRSEDVYGGSNTAINMYGQDDVGDASTSFNLYLNPRILTYDINKNGKREVFIAKNDSPAGRLLKNVKIFTSTEFFNLQWDSLGLSENWRTKKLTGYAADYQIKDVDNDGEDEIVIALVTSAGSLTSRSSVIVTYKLRGQ